MEKSVVSSFEEQLEEHKSFAYTARGVSMRPLIRQRKDLIVIEKFEGELERFDVALYKREDGAYVLHRVIGKRRSQTGGELIYEILGDNCIKKEYVKESQVLGVLTELVRGRKRIRTKMPDVPRGYLLYVKFWFFIYPVRVTVKKISAKLGAFARKIMKR